MNATTTNAAKSVGTGRQLGFLGGLLLILIILMAVNFGYVARQQNFVNQYLDHSGELRIVSQSLAKDAADAVTGSAESFRLLNDDRAEFARRLGLLRAGDPKTGLPPSPTLVAPELAQVENVWKEVSAAADIIVSRWEVITSLHDVAQTLDATIPDLQALSQGVVDDLVQARAPQAQIAHASRQVLLLERIVRNVNVVLKGGLDAVTAADSFGRDTAEFGRVLEGMLNGNRELGVDRVGAAAIRTRLESVGELFAAVKENAGRILETSPELFQVRDAADTVSRNSTPLLEASTALESSYDRVLQKSVVSPVTGYVLLGIAVLVLILLSRRFVAESRARLDESNAQNQRNQEAILRLLDEMGDLADGDLTVHATVTEDFTGAIADSINYAIEQLRTLVSAINSTAQQVSGAADHTRGIAENLAEASRHQAREIGQATSAINTIADSIQGVSGNATESTDVARKAVEIANKGHQTVQDTIHGMDAIREHIQETAKRIKRLGESSQEIGNIVSLINDIAEQTNILALNAAIQAASAGEAGRGFAVVADEVQRLAERSGNATKQIEALVKTIQTDTNEAVISMEQSTAEVVSGARLAQNAGVALEEIDSVSKHLADLIQSISDAAGQQSQSATEVSQTMRVIDDITGQTLEGANTTATSISQLADLASSLRDSVADFRLPVDEAEEEPQQQLA